MFTTMSETKIIQIVFFLVSFLPVQIQKYPKYTYTNKTVCITHVLRHSLFLDLSSEPMPQTSQRKPSADEYKHELCYPPSRHRTTTILYIMLVPCYITLLFCSNLLHDHIVWINMLSKR